MRAALVLPRDLGALLILQHAARQRRCVFLAGLPGVGKSLLLQQLALLAAEAGRALHTLQWDVARGAFETPEILTRYPEVDGVTHAAIRKAAGLWARGAVSAWRRAHADARHLLLGEVPLVGNRLIELAQRRSDDVELLLASEETLFLVPVPTCAVRQVIETSRVREMASPRHERERANAPPGVVQALWEEVARVAACWGLATPGPGGAYDPDLYLAVYCRLLRHRRVLPLPITDVLPVSTSAYELPAAADDLVPTPDEVRRALVQVERIPAADVEREVAGWFHV